MDSIGDLALLYDCVRTETVEVIEDCELIILKKESFQKHIKLVKTLDFQIIFEYFKTSKIFKDFDKWEEEIKKISLKSSLKNFPSGTLLFREGEFANSVFFVKQGIIKVFKKLYIPVGESNDVDRSRISDEKEEEKEIEVEIEEVGKNSTFCSYEIITNAPLYISGISSSPVILISLNKYDLEGIFDKKIEQLLLGLHRPYPTENIIKNIFNNTNNWSQYKENTMNKTYSELKNKKILKNFLGQYSRNPFCFIPERNNVNQIISDVPLENTNRNSVEDFKGYVENILEPLVEPQYKEMFEKEKEIPKTILKKTLSKYKLNESAVFKKTFLDKIPKSQIQLEHRQYLFPEENSPKIKKKISFATMNTLNNLNNLNKSKKNSLLDCASSSLTKSAMQLKKSITSPMTSSIFANNSNLNTPNKKTNEITLAKNEILENSKKKDLKIVKKFKQMSSDIYPEMFTPKTLYKKVLKKVKENKRTIIDNNNNNSEDMLINLKRKIYKHSSSYLGGLESKKSLEFKNSQKILPKINTSVNNPVTSIVLND